jgi:hypothetical protein
MYCEVSNITRGQNYTKAISFATLKNTLNQCIHGSFFVGTISSPSVKAIQYEVKKEGIFVLP